MKALFGLLMGAVALLLVACGGEADNTEASSTSGGSVVQEGHGTVEFEGETYEITYMNCRRGRWHGSSDSIYFRVNPVTGVNQDYDRYNLTLTLHPAGGPSDDSATWLMVHGAEHWQAQAEASEQGIRGSGVVYPRGETVLNIDDERVKPVHFDMRC